jgi:hypothetical protein
VLLCACVLCEQTNQGGCGVTCVCLCASLCVPPPKHALISTTTSLICPAGPVSLSLSVFLRFTHTLTRVISLPYLHACPLGMLSLPLSPTSYQDRSRHLVVLLYLYLHDFLCPVSAVVASTALNSVPAPKSTSVIHTASLMIAIRKHIPIRGSTLWHPCVHTMRRKNSSTHQQT